MKKTSIVIDDETQCLVDEFCGKEGMQFSEAIRTLIKRGLKNYDQEKSLNFHDTVGPAGLMVNQKRAIKASIESTLILRKLASELSKTDDALDGIKEEVFKIMADGWYYDNQ